MRYRNLSVTAVAMAALLISCTSFTKHPEIPPGLGYLYNSITFEIAPVAGAEPSPRALRFFRNRLDDNHICRYQDVTFVIRRAIPSAPPGMIWSSTTINAYENLRRSIHDQTPNDRHLKIFVAYIDGIYLDIMRGPRFLGGIQYSPTAFAMFKSGCGAREGPILLHEFGHILGLVKGADRENHDADHRFHCVVRNCVMHYTVMQDYADFDLYCRRDIVAMIRAREAEEEFEAVSR